MATKVSTPIAIDITPGVRPAADATPSSTPHYTYSQGIRFESGNPQKIGGNIALQFDYGDTIDGTVRSIYTSIIEGQYYALIGSNEKLYAIIGSRLENITPFLTSSNSAANALSTQYNTLGSNPFTSIMGSPTLTVSDVNGANRFEPGDTVYYSGAVGFAGISAGAINGDNIVRSVNPMAGTYTINIGTNATSSTSGGGAAVIRYSGLIRVTEPNTLADGDRVKIQNVAVFTAASATVTTPGTGYAPNDVLTVNGGTFGTAAAFNVASAKAISGTIFSVQSGAGSYAPGDTLTIVGGTHSASSVFTVATTGVLSATIAAGGTGGTTGIQTVTGTTGTGTKFQASVTIAGGVITAVNSILVVGNYTVNPTTITAEPVTGASLSGATLNLIMGVETITLTTAGAYTSLPGSPAATTSSGAGTGATINLVWGVNAVTVNTAGTYSATPANPVVTTDNNAGTGATLTVSYSGTGNFGGIANTDINRDFIVRNASATYFDILTGGFATSSVTGGGGSLAVFYTEIPPGNLNEVVSQGYGAGLYGAGLYGTALISSSGRSFPRIWFFDRYANTFIMTPGNQGGLYQWFGDGSIGPDPIGGDNAPTAINYVFVASDIIVTLGAGGSGMENRIFSCDQDNITVWTSSSTNQVFDDNVEGAGRLISHCPANSLNLIFTENQTYTFRYIGLPLVWEILPLDLGIGIIAPLARVPVKDTAYWMGQENFYLYRGGKVEIIPANTQYQSTAIRHVFDNLNWGQKSKIFAWYNKQYNEVWFHYPSAASNECDSVVKVCLGDSTWSIDTMNRTAAENPTVTQNNPQLANVGTIYKHEFGTDDNGQPLAFVLTGPRRYFGKENVLLSGIIPDSIQIGDITFTATGYRFPQSSTPTYATSFPISPTTEQVVITSSGRFYDYTWSGAVLGQDWEMGQWYESVQTGATQ